MLIVGGSGNNRGALLGGVARLGALERERRPADRRPAAGMQARAAALQIVLIGVVLAALLVVRPRGLLGEEAVVSRHARPVLDR